MPSLRANSAPRARALRTLRTAIHSGSLASGDVLPSERDLSATLSLNRGGVRWAIATLEAEGLIQSRGARTRVVAPRALQLVKGAHPLMSNTVAVLSTPSLGMERLEDDAERRGWMGAVVRGCLHGLALQGLHPLLVNPVHVRQGWPGDRSVMPSGVLMPELRVDREVVQAIAGWLHAARTPVVVYGGDPVFAEFDRVISDHEAGAYMLAQWLIGQGRRRIVEVWPRTAGYWLQARHAGYERAMKEAGRSVAAPVLCPSFAEPPASAEGFETEARAFAGSLVDRLVGADAADAFMVHSDGDVARVAAACRLCGRAPNADVWLTGYDNYAAAIRTQPFLGEGPLATVDKRNFAAGQAMAELLVARVNGSLPAPAQVRTVGPELVVLKNRGEQP